MPLRIATELGAKHRDTLFVPNTPQLRSTIKKQAKSGPHREPIQPACYPPSFISVPK
jgi:hypothetical protein